MHRKCVQQAGIVLPKSQSHQHISQSFNDQFYCDECGGSSTTAASANNSNVNSTSTAANVTAITSTQENATSLPTTMEKMDESSFESSPILNAIANNSTSPPKTSGCRPLSFQAPPSTAQVRVATRPFTVSADRENVVSLLMRHNETTMGMMNSPNFQSFDQFLKENSHKYQPSFVNQDSLDQDDTKRKRMITKEDKEEEREHHQIKMTRSGTSTSCAFNMF